MATFRKRSGKWQVRIQRQGYPDQCKTFLLRNDAESWARKTELELDQGLLIPKKSNYKKTLGDLLSKYLIEVTPHKKGYEMETYRIRYWLKNPLSQRFISTIRSSDFAVWKESRIIAGKAPNTIRLELAIISHLYTIAKSEWGFEHLENPTLKVTLPKLPNGKTRRLNDGELDLIFKNTNSKLLKSIVIFALETGMRRSEITSLEWKNFNINIRTILIPTTKNGEAREVPLSSIATKTLMEIKNCKSRKVFNITPHAVTIAFRRACIRSGIEDLPFHTLRHEAISRFFEKGFSLAEVAAISGHKTWSMLKRYTHLKAENLVTKMD